MDIWVILKVLQKVAFAAASLAAFAHCLACMAGLGLQIYLPTKYQSI